MTILLVSILELQKQPKEIGRELKSSREELELAKNADDKIEGDRFTDAIEVQFLDRASFFELAVSRRIKDFITRADDDVARLELLDSEMTQAYQHLCDFLAIDQKNYSLNEFFTDLKTFCSFFSVDDGVRYRWTSLPSMSSF